MIRGLETVSAPEAAGAAKRAWRRRETTADSPSPKNCDMSLIMFRNSLFSWRRLRTSRSMSSMRSSLSPERISTRASRSRIWCERMSRLGRVWGRVECGEERKGGGKVAMEGRGGATGREDRRRRWGRSMR